MWYYIQSFSALAFLALLIASSIWLYVQFRLPSIPWLWAALAIVVASDALRAFHISIDQADHIASRLAISVGDLLAIEISLINIFATLAKALACWFVLSEMTFAYHSETAESTIAKILLIPRNHPAKIGVTLIACLLAKSLLPLATLFYAS
jgi:hypothetical protein